jgi:hypothetical protein
VLGFSNSSSALSDKERLVHAPMSDLGGMLFDRDAVCIDLPDWKVGVDQRCYIIYYISCVRIF